MLKNCSFIMDQELLMSSKFDNDEITINIRELLFALWSKIYIIIAVGILAGILTFTGTKLFVSPVYTSVTKVYILSRQDESAGLTYNDLQLGSQLMQDYMELIKSRPVLETVISDLNLSLSPEQLSNMVTVNAPTNSRILSISANASSAEEAQAIANALREAVSTEFSEILDVNSVSTVEEASLPSSPSSPNIQKNVFLGILIGFAVAIIILSILFLMDDTIKTSEDIEHYLNLNVLSSVPMQKELKKVKPSKKRFKKSSIKSRRKNSKNHFFS